jgi:hypothetical protein
LLVLVLAFVRVRVRVLVLVPDTRARSHLHATLRSRERSTMRVRWTLFMATFTVAACSGDAVTDPGPDAGTTEPWCDDAYAYTADDCGDETATALLMDLDSDRDGLTDYDELCVHGTDPCDPDTDGDGYTDLAEVTAGTDPNDASEGIPEEDFYAILPYEGPAEVQTLEVVMRVHRADVYFLLDTTGSMENSLANVQANAEDITDWLGEHVADVQMGVGHYEDFPFDSFGTEHDVPFSHLQDITPDANAVHAAIDPLEGAYGGDAPASGVEALFQTATAAGGSWSHEGESHALPSRTCPSVVGESSPRVGYPCFRPGALPIVVMTGDYHWHNNQQGNYTYTGIHPHPATFDQSASALDAIGARYIGVWQSHEGSASVEEMARRTGSVNADGLPLSYIRPSSQMTDGILEGLETLLEETPQNVTSATEAVQPEGFDVSALIESIEPIEGRRDEVEGPNPGVTYTDLDDSTFYGVIPGTELELAVQLRNGVLPSGESAQILHGRIHILGHGGAWIDTRQVYVIVPPADAEG